MLIYRRKDTGCTSRQNLAFSTTIIATAAMVKTPILKKTTPPVKRQKRSASRTLLLCKKELL
jgi:hypothetical protein